MALEVKPATAFDAFNIGENMRLRDVEECWAYAHLHGRDAIFACLEASPYARTVWWRGKQAAMFGVGIDNYLSRIGHPWMLATPLLYEFPMVFLRHSRRFIAEMLDAAPILENHVLASNAESIRWLKWCGFKFDEAPAPWGQEGRLCYRYMLTKQQDGDAAANISGVKS